MAENHSLQGESSGSNLGGRSQGWVGSQWNPMRLFRGGRSPHQVVWSTGPPYAPVAPQQDSYVDPPRVLQYCHPRSYDPKLPQVSRYPVSRTRPSEPPRQPPGSSGPQHAPPVQSVHELGTRHQPTNTYQPPPPPPAPERALPQLPPPPPPPLSPPTTAKNPMTWQARVGEAAQQSASAEELPRPEFVTSSNYVLLQTVVNSEDQLKGQPGDAVNRLLQSPKEMPKAMERQQSPTQSTSTPNESQTGPSVSSSTGDPNETIYSDGGISAREIEAIEDRKRPKTLRKKDPERLQSGHCLPVLQTQSRGSPHPWVENYSPAHLPISPRDSVRNSVHHKSPSTLHTILQPPNSKAAPIPMATRPTPPNPNSKTTTTPSPQNNTSTKPTCSLNLVSYRSGTKGCEIRQIQTALRSRFKDEETFLRALEENPELITTDVDFFRKLREVYSREMCSVWRRGFSLKTLRGIRLLSFTPTSRPTIVPLDDFILQEVLYAYRNPSGIGTGHEWIDWVFRLRQPDRRHALEFVEGRNGTRIAVVGSIPWLFSILVGVVWSVRGKNVQTAFTVAGFILTSGTLLLALLAIISGIELPGRAST